MSNSILVSPHDLSKGDAIKFTIASEPWIVYKLEDNTFLHLRLIVIKFVRLVDKGEAGEPLYSFTPQLLLATYAPKEKKGTPSPGILSPNLKDYHFDQVDFERISRDEWNVYNLEDETVVKVKAEVSGVFRTDKFAPDGDPYYIVNYQTISSPKISPKLIRKSP